MHRTYSFLLGLALLGFGQAAQAQTTPPPQPKSAAGKAPRPQKTPAQAPGAYPKPFIKDTAAFNRKFRRSGRPADAVPNRLPLPKQ